jgi:predicted MFS family arabinose efflux permease
VRAVVRLYRAAFADLPRDVWLLSIAALVNRAGTMVLPFISLYLTQERALTVPEVGRLLALYGLGSIIGSYLGGWLSDRIGAIRAQQISLIGSGFGFLWMGQLRDPAAIAVAMLLVSIVSESFRPAVMTAVTHRSPPEIRARSFALLRLAVNLGWGLGPAVGGALALHSYTWLFVGDAITSWLGAILLWAFLTRGCRVSEIPSKDAAQRARSPWRDGPFLALMLLVMAMAMVIFQIFSTLPLYFRQAYGFRENAIGLLLGFNALLIVLFEMVLIHWAERRDRMMLAGLGGFLLCAGFALMPLGSSAAFVAFTVAVWTFGEMLCLPLINAIVADRGGAGNVGRYMGLYTMAFSVSFVFAPMLGTWVFDRFGANTLWAAVGVLGPLLWLAAAALRGTFREPEAAAAAASD